MRIVWRRRLGICAALAALASSALCVTFRRAERNCCEQNCKGNERVSHLHVDHSALLARPGNSLPLRTIGFDWSTAPIVVPAFEGLTVTVTMSPALKVVLLH